MDETYKAGMDIVFYDHAIIMHDAELAPFWIKAVPGLSHMALFFPGYLCPGLCFMVAAYCCDELASDQVP